MGGGRCPRARGKTGALASLALSLSLARPVVRISAYRWANTPSPLMLTLMPMCSLTGFLLRDKAG